MFRGRVWRLCRPLIVYARRAANSPLSSAGLHPRRWTTRWRSGSEEGGDPRRREDLYSVPHIRLPGERESNPESFSQQHGNCAERSGESHRQRAAERPQQMERRLGKLQARHPQVNDLYDLALRNTAEVVRLFWQIKEDRKNRRESREGAYLLSTNLKADTTEELRSKYMRLREGVEERAFGSAFVSPARAAS